MTKSGDETMNFNEPRHGQQQVRDTVLQAPMVGGREHSPSPSPTPGTSDGRPPEFSDEALALQFTDRHHHDLRYVDAWGKWLIWDGRVWHPDDTMRTMDLARAICRDAAATCDIPRNATAIASAKTVAAVERLARADRRHAATVKQWDVDPWLLNTPGGVIDLRTGDRHPHQPGDHMTKIAAITPDGVCPRWRRFLDQVTAGDDALQAYLQRVAGYCLTGLTREQVLFFIYGTGGNGKGVFLNTLCGIMGSYAMTAAAETFTASSHARHLTELARLRGSRLVVAQETEQGRPWAEARIKSITGGDPITANFMRQDHFEFLPMFKLAMAGNHKPVLGSVDEAIRRRLHLILFAFKISPDDRDLDLPDKLKAEWPGILQWMVEGCLMWLAEGLARPPAVSAATDDYLDAEDTMGQWLAAYADQEMHLQRRLDWRSSAELYASWCSWAEKVGEIPRSQKQFCQALEARGFRRQRKPGERGFEWPMPTAQAA